MCKKGAIIEVPAETETVHDGAAAEYRNRADENDRDVDGANQTDQSKMIRTGLIEFTESERFFF